MAATIFNPKDLTCPYCDSALIAGPNAGEIASDGTGVFNGVACHAVWDVNGKPLKMPDGTDIATAVLAALLAMQQRIEDFLDATMGQNKVNRSDIKTAYQGP